MEIGCWNLLLSGIGVLATGGLGWYFYKRTGDIATETKEFLVTLIVNSAPDPKTLERLLNDHKNTGKWRGAAEPDPNKPGYSRIAWHAQLITSMGIASEEVVPEPKLIQSEPKPSKKE